MFIKQLRDDLKKLLKRYNLEKKISKQQRLFEQNLLHPSLHTEKLEPKHLHIYSFRIDKKYRAMFILTPDKKAEIIDINLHYQ